MKTKVKKLRFIAKIARNIACLTALFALSASAEDTRTLGYATSGTAAALPAAPDMSGAVVNVTAAQAQYVLDGAYGSIDGKTINFTESVADTLVIGRASKYEGSGTLYRHGSHDGEAMSYADFIAYKNQAYYERTVENVTFTADAGVIVNFTAEGGAHVYGTESAPVYDYVRDTGTWTFDTNNGFFKRAILKNITFKGLTFTAKTDFNTSEATTVFDGFTFTGCTFETGISTDEKNQALRYYDEYNNGNLRNLVVENCTFKNCYHGIYTGNAKGVTVKGCTFETVGYNAIAIQSQGVCDYGTVVITGNTFKDIANRIIRFNEVGSGTTITIADNTADGNSGKLDSATGKREIVAAVSLPENVAEMISASNNDWGANAVAEGAFADAKPVAATIGTVSYETLDAAIAAVKDGETVVVNAGEYKLNGSLSYTGKAFTIKAAEGAKVSFDMSAAVALHEAKITFEGVTFDYKTNNDYTGLQHANTLVYNDCTINGKVFLYATSETFNRCVFNQSAKDYNVWTYGAQKVAFNACTFNCAGKSVLVYNEGTNEKTDLAVTACEFKASAGVAGKAAIEINTSLMKGDSSVTIDDQTTATGFATGSNSGSTLWNDKKQTKDTNKNVTVTVAGKTVFAPADGSKERPYSREQFGAMTRVEYIAAQTRLGGTLYVSVGDYSYDQYGTLGNGERNDTVGQIPDRSKLNAYGENGYLGEKNDGANGHTVVFVGGTITSGATGYTSIDNIGTHLLLAVPAYTKVKFEKTTFNNVFSFNYQLYTSPWSQLGSLAFEGCTFNGLVVGSIASTELAFDGCTFTDYRNSVSANNSNPTWIRPAYGNWTKGDNEGQGTDFRSLTSISFTGNTVTSTRPVKFERIAQWEMETTVTATDNAFDITPQEGDTSPKNVGLYFGANAKFDLVADKNTKSDGTAALYTAAYKAPNGTDYDGLPAGSTVKNAAGEDVTIDDARVWKKTDTLTLKTTEEVASVTNAKGVSVAFATLAEALAAAKDGETVTLLADVTEDVTVATSVTLDLGGKTLTNAGAGKVTLTIAEGKTVTVKNGSIVGGASNYTIQNKGTATFEGVTATAGNVGSSMLDNAGTLTINSGTYVGGMNTVKNESEATLTINGGTFENSYGENNAHTGVIYNLGHVAITGGELTQKATGPMWAGPHVVMTDWDGANKPSVTITGGTFTCDWTSYRATIINDAGGGTAGCTTVSGGTFNKKVPENYCAAGFIPKANDDGTYGVKEGAFVAAIGDVKYETLADALAAAKDGETVKMLADVTVADATTVKGKTVTLDLGGKTLTSSTTASALEVAADAALTVVDSVGDGCVKATGNYSNGIENKGVLVVEDGHFEAAYGAIRALGGSTTTVNGGMFSSSTGRYGLYYWANGTALSVTINGGVFMHAVSTAMEGGKVSLAVKGGAFATDLTAFCTDKDYGTFLDAAKNLYVYDKKSAHQPDSYVVDEDGNVTIADEAALIWFARQVNEEGNTFKGKTVKLQADVTLTKTWTPVGVSVAKSFRGVFDGDGHTISGMRVAGSYQGFGFGFFKTVVSATVKNVTFANAEVKGAFSNIVGLVVGYSYGSSVFEDVHVTGSTVYAFGKVGGLVGYAEDRNATTTFKGCSVSATTIHGGYNVAGFCGLVQGRCEVRGSILQGIETIIDEDAQGFGKVVELDTTVVCDGSVATCAGKGTVIKGKYIPKDGYYWSAWSDLYNHYGDGSHDCTLADGKLLANSEVVHDMPVEIGDVKYSDLQAAFDAAKKGDTVTLLSDITLTEQVNITKALDGLTLDGNDKTITCATTDDPLKSGGSALYFGSASDHLYCTGIAIKNLTMTGTARFAIFLCGGTSTTFTKVKISGNYYIAINLYGTHGATMTGCDISNSTTGTDKYISAIWSNVASANPLTLNNTKVNVIAINKYEASNKLAPKIYVNADSTVAEIHTYDDGEFSGDMRLCVGASPVMPPVKIYDETDKTWIDAPAEVFVKALDEKGRVTLPDALLEKVAGATRFEKFTNLSKADANGNLAWVNLVAGIDSAKKVAMTAPQNDDADVIDVDLPTVGAAPAGTDVTVLYEIRAEGSDAAVVSATTAEDLVINLNGKAGIGTYRAYVCLLQNGTEVARVASENKLGVLQTVSAAKKTIIAVPWLSLTDGNAIAVADLVKTAGLTAGDKLHVYNKAESRYDVYELAADMTWTPKAIYKVGADGTVEAVSSGTPETTTVARGNGVWLERQDMTKAIVSYGQVASGTVATTIDAGTAEKPTWNLLAVPTTTAVDIAATFGASEADTLIVPTAGAPKICTVKDGAWGYEKSVPVTDESGNQLGVKVVREKVTELPAGTGFWYLNGGAANTVNW